MPKDKISQYAFTPAANTDIGGINIDEGCAPSGINNAIRTLMTQIRDLQAGVSGDTIPLTAGGTGSGTAASARAALGLAIGTNVLGYVTPGASGNILLSDGSNWTSVAQSAAITLDTITGGPLALAKGGTNATTAAQARTNLGVAIGTNVLGYVTAGATGQVLTSTGTGWISQAAAGGGFSEMTVFTSPGTFTTPATTTKIKVTVQGAGGGGGTWSGSPATQASGGGGGSYGVGIYPVTASTPYPVTIGAAGTAPGPGSNGTSGGTTSFGALVSATGGGGGTSGPGLRTGGAAGGAVTPTQLTIPGAAGGNSGPAGSQGFSGGAFLSVWPNGPGYGKGGQAGSAGNPGVIIVEF